MLPKRAVSAFFAYTCLLAVGTFAETTGVPEPTTTSQPTLAVISSTTVAATATPATTSATTVDATTMPVVTSSTTVATTTTPAITSSTTVASTTSPATISSTTVANTTMPVVTSPTTVATTTTPAITPSTTVSTTTATTSPTTVANTTMPVVTSSTTDTTTTSPAATSLTTNAPTIMPVVTSSTTVATTTTPAITPSTTVASTTSPATISPTTVANTTMPVVTSPTTVATTSTPAITPSTTVSTTTSPAATSPTTNAPTILPVVTSPATVATTTTPAITPSTSVSTTTSTTSPTTVENTTMPVVTSSTTVTTTTTPAITPSTTVASTTSPAATSPTTVATTTIPVITSTTTVATSTTLTSIPSTTVSTPVNDAQETSTTAQSSPIASSTTAVPTTTTAIPPSTTTIATTDGTPTRNFALSCWECDRENLETCAILRTVVDCPRVTDVCFVKAERVENDLLLTKGCQPRDTCAADQKLNGAVCDSGNVTDACKWCCESAKCNDQVKPTPSTTAQPTTTPPTTTVAIPTSTTEVSRPNTTLQCWECTRVNSLGACDAMRTLRNCPGVTDVCFLTASNARGVLLISTGCRPREECLSNQEQNGPMCKVGIVTDSCNWCCEGDRCNDRVNPTTKAPVVTTIATTPQPPPTTIVPCTAAPTTPASQCDLLAYRKCDAEMQQLVYSAFVTPDQLLNNFCRFLPELSKCVIVIEGCAGCGGEIRFNSSIIGALINMSSLCSSTCDVTAAMLCLNRYYQQVSMALISGGNVDCVHLSRVRIEQQSCYAVAISSCDMTVRKSLQTFFLSIERQVINVCFAAPPTVQPPDCIERPPSSSAKPSTKPPGSSSKPSTAKPSTKPPGSSSKPSTAKPSTKPPGSSSKPSTAKPSTKPPGSSSKPSTAKPSTKPPKSSSKPSTAKPSTKPPGSSSKPSTAKPSTKPPGSSTNPPPYCPTTPAATTVQTSTVTTTPPTDEDSKYCNRSLAIDCISSFNYEVMVYQSNDGNNIVEVCRKLEWSKECYIQASLNCSKHTCDQLTASWNRSASIVSEKCVAIEKPKCDTTAARACILELWRTVDGAEDFEKACRLLNATITCVETEMEGCSPDEIAAMNNSLQIVINLIGKRCDNVIEISPGCNSSIEICEGGNNGLIFYRFGRSPAAICGSADNCRIFIDIDIEIGGVRNPRCRNGKVISQAVVQIDEEFKATMTSQDDAFSREITEANWNQNQTISLAGRIDFSYDGDQKRQVTVTYRKTISGKTVESRTIGTYILRICDRDRPSICSIVNDPHITTFDGLYYNNFQEGFFVAYRHKVLPYEVQVATQKCNAVASCNCAVGVRSGDTVFFIDSCRKKSFVQRYCKGRDKYECVNLMKTSLFAHNQITPGTRIFSRNNGKEFVVWFPHGTMVKITYNGNYLNLWLTPAPGDWGRNEGLCGIWDGRPKNDLMLRDGTTFVGQGAQQGSQPTVFNINWRVPDADIISGGVAENKFLPPYYCVQERVGTAIVSRCGYDAILETCDLDTSGAEILATATLNEAPPADQSGRRLRKRDTAAATNDFDLDATTVQPAINTTNSAWNETTARAYCQKYFQSMAATGNCMNNNVTSGDSSLNACVDDLVVTGNTTWMDTAMEALKEQCLQEIQRNPTMQNSSVATSILSNACPNQCSQNGICSNATCICNSTFTGPDCSINTAAPVSVAIPVNNGLCDVRSSNCYVAKVLGVGFIPGVTTCIVQPAVVTSVVAVAGQSSNLGPAVFISQSEVHCVMTQLTSAYVQLTNTPSNSTLMQSSPLFIVYDSVCFTCLASDGVTQPSCTQLSSSCVINGQCYASGQQNPKDSCQVCDPQTSTSSFSPSTASACIVTSTTQNPGNDGESQVGLIVGLTVGLSVLAAIVIALVTWLCIKRYIERSVDLLHMRQAAALGQQGDQSDVRVAPPRYDGQMSHSYMNESYSGTQTHSTNESQKREKTVAL